MYALSNHLKNDDGFFYFGNYCITVTPTFICANKEDVVE